jgi:hypothetical protein
MLKSLVLQKNSGDPGISWTITEVTLIQQQLNNFLTDLRIESATRAQNFRKPQAVKNPSWFNAGTTPRPTTYFER